MKRIISAISAILLLFSVCFACAEDEIDGYGVLGESYEMGKGSVKLVAYDVDQVNSSNAIFLVFEFTNNGKEALSFSDEAWYYTHQEDEELYVVLAEDPRLNPYVEYCDPGATIRITDAYYLYDLKGEVKIELFRTDQLCQNHIGEVFYRLDIANEPKAVGEGYKWEDL